MNVKSSNKLKQVLASIGRSNLILDEGIKNKGIECLMAAFTGFRHDMDTLNIFGGLIYFEYNV